MAVKKKVSEPVVMKKVVDKKPPVGDQKARWIKQAVEVVSQFEGNHGYGNISDNFDGQGLSCGVMNWNLGQGTLIDLFPDDIVRKYMDEHADIFMKMTRPHQSVLDRVSLAVQLQKDPRAWEFFCDDLSVMLRSEEGIAIQNAVIEKTLAKFAFENLPSEYPSFRSFLFMMDVRVQNGGLKGLKYGDKTTDDDFFEVIKSLPEINNYMLDLAHLAYLRSKKCNPKWAMDVFTRKMLIATSHNLNPKRVIKLPSYELMEERLDG